MNTPQWIKYDGSDKQIAEINDSVMRHGFILRNKYGSISPVIKQPWHVTLIGDRDTTHYLICQPHPYADVIKIWADTGCPVYAKHRETGQKCALQGPRIDWNYEEWEFSLTPFED